jgi:hypothetical protein
MIECACECDYDYDGESIFDVTANVTAKEYRTCSECGDTIWPWQTHTEGLWWDCSDCDQWDDDCGCDAECQHGKTPDSASHMCATCNNACDSLLCGCWWVGQNWEQIAERNEMTRAECLG